jgi:AraC-like DNA-binding protein
VVRRRLEHAQHLLATSSLTVSEICNGIGMESLGSFSWLFRQRFGCSPDAYRRALTGRPPRGST